MARLPFLLVLSLFATTLYGDDLTVGWISRLPEIDFVWGSTNPRVEGWPAEAQAITWRAHVRNFGPAQQGVAYRWTVDGHVASSGTVAIAANGVTTIDLPSTWTRERSRIALAIDTANVVTEESESNNSLEVFSDALAVGFWVEQSVYNYFRENQWRLGVGSTSFENWAQRHIQLFNDMAAMAIHAETPDGVLDRWRLQKIVVVPDGALPLTALTGIRDPSKQATGTTHPDISDRTVDLMWGFRAASLGLYGDRLTAHPSNPFYMAPVFLHELGHARFLTDVYAFNVKNQPPGHRIDIRENGQPIVGTYIPASSYVYYTPEQGLMNEHYTFIDRYSAINMNQVAGFRARWGNYNDPEDVGSFLNDLPTQNRITIRDRFGNLMTDANVWIYQATGGIDAWYATQYDDVPDLKLRTDTAGHVLVGRNPFSAAGSIVSYWRGANTVAIVRVEKNGSVAYGFLESRLFNLAYWRGNTMLAHHDLTVGMTQLCSNKGPVLRGPAWDAEVKGEVTLQWDPVPGARNYTVWVSSDLSAPRILGTTNTTSMPARLSGRAYWWVEAETNLCGSRRSESSRLRVEPEVTRRRSVRR